VLRILDELVHLTTVQRSLRYYKTFRFVISLSHIYGYSDNLKIRRTCWNVACRHVKSLTWVSSLKTSFYCAMHFSAKCGIAIACRLSVTLVNCDHIGWNSSKIISPLVSLGRLLFATPTRRVCSKGNTPKFGPKVTHPRWFERWRHSIANCGRMVTHSATVTMGSL